MAEIITLPIKNVVSVMNTQALRLADKLDSLILSQAQQKGVLREEAARLNESEKQLLSFAPSQPRDRLLAEVVATRTWLVILGLHTESLLQEALTLRVRIVRNMNVGKGVRECASPSQR